MSKKVTLSIEIDENLKNNAQEILDDLGLDMTTAIKMYLKKVNACQGIPFTLKRTSLQEALAEVKRGEVEVYDSVEDMWNAMNKDD